MANEQLKKLCCDEFDLNLFEWHEDDKCLFKMFQPSADDLIQIKRNGIAEHESSQKSTRSFSAECFNRKVCGAVFKSSDIRVEVLRRSNIAFENLSNFRQVRAIKSFNVSTGELVKQSTKGDEAAGIVNKESPVKEDSILTVVLMESLDSTDTLIKTKKDVSKNWRRMLLDLFTIIFFTHEIGWRKLNNFSRTFLFIFNYF